MELKLLPNHIQLALHLVIKSKNTVSTNCFHDHCVSGLDCASHQCINEHSTVIVVIQLQLNFSNYHM